ncbi:hypothetical protein CBR_g31125 [Chara braunii]|uniref:Reverse transcriptase domain-containing protein n=1 Tax=Chara braunii TaxID=69332 RepID=A0A388LED2_CHABU|nr:hypothetical protein CBR_g31125 [Chara braunii]|eukprot:GBG80665.1 hypothetical protein CBR_g31125 [Chara braunii]
MSPPDLYLFDPAHHLAGAWLATLRAQQYDDHEAQINIPARLGGDAHHWFSTYVWVDLPIFERDFMNRFDYVQSEQALYMIKDRVQKPLESVAEYRNRFYRMFVKTERGEQVGRDLFIDGLRSRTIRAKLRKQFFPITHTLQQIMAVAEEIELKFAANFLDGEDYPGDGDSTELARARAELAALQNKFENMGFVSGPVTYMEQIGPKRVILRETPSIFAPMMPPPVRALPPPPVEAPARTNESAAIFELTKTLISLIQESKKEQREHNARLEAMMRNMRPIAFFCTAGVYGAAKFRFTSNPQVVVLAEAMTFQRRAAPGISHVSTVVVFSGDITAFDPARQAAIKSTLYRWGRDLATDWDRRLTRHGDECYHVDDIEVNTLRTTLRESSSQNLLPSSRADEPRADLDQKRRPKRNRKEAEEESEGELRREAEEAAARLAEDEEEEEEEAEEETSDEEEEAYSEYSEGEQSEEEDEDDEEVESGGDQEPMHDELERVPGPDRSLEREPAAKKYRKVIGMQRVAPWNSVLLKTSQAEAAGDPPTKHQGCGKMKSPSSQSSSWRASSHGSPTRDPLVSRSTVATVLREARASLKHPSRPYTPLEDMRQLRTRNNANHLDISAPVTNASFSRSRWSLDPARDVAGAMELGPSQQQSRQPAACARSPYAAAIPAVSPRRHPMIQGKNCELLRTSSSSQNGASTSRSHRRPCAPRRPIGSSHPLRRNAPLPLPQLNDKRGDIPTVPEGRHNGNELQGAHESMCVSEERGSSRHLEIRHSLSQNLEPNVLNPPQRRDRDGRLERALTAADPKVEYSQGRVVEVTDRDERLGACGPVVQQSAVKGRESFDHQRSQAVAGPDIGGRAASSSARSGPETLDSGISELQEIRSMDGHLKRSKVTSESVLTHEDARYRGKIENTIANEMTNGMACESGVRDANAHACGVIPLSTSGGRGCECTPSEGAQPLTPHNCPKYEEGLLGNSLFGYFCSPGSSSSGNSSSDNITLPRIALNTYHSRSSTGQSAGLNGVVQSSNFQEVLSQGIRAPDQTDSSCGASSQRGSTTVCQENHSFHNANSFHSVHSESTWQSTRVSAEAIQDDPRVNGLLDTSSGRREAWSRRRGYGLIGGTMPGYGNVYENRSDFNDRTVHPLQPSLRDDIMSERMRFAGQNGDTNEAGGMGTEFDLVFDHDSVFGMENEMNCMNSASFVPSGPYGFSMGEMLAQQANLVHGRWLVEEVSPAEHVERRGTTFVGWEAGDGGLHGPLFGVNPFSEAEVSARRRLSPVPRQPPQQVEDAKPASRNQDTTSSLPPLPPTPMVAFTRKSTEPGLLSAYSILKTNGGDSDPCWLVIDMGGWRPDDSSDYNGNVLEPWSLPLADPSWESGVYNSEDFCAAHSLEMHNHHYHHHYHHHHHYYPQGQVTEFHQHDHYHYHCTDPRHAGMPFDGPLQGAHQYCYPACHQNVANPYEDQHEPRRSQEGTMQEQSLGMEGSVSIQQERNIPLSREGGQTEPLATPISGDSRVRWTTTMQGSLTGHAEDGQQTQEMPEVGCNVEMPCNRRESSTFTGSGCAQQLPIGSEEKPKDIVSTAGERHVPLEDTSTGQSCPINPDLLHLRHYGNQGMWLGSVTRAGRGRAEGGGDESSGEGVQGAKEGVGVRGEDRSAVLLETIDTNSLQGAEAGVEGVHPTSVRKQSGMQCPGPGVRKWHGTKNGQHQDKVEGKVGCKEKRRKRKGGRRRLEDELVVVLRDLVKISEGLGLTKGRTKLMGRIQVRNAKVGLAVRNVNGCRSLANYGTRDGDDDDSEDGLTGKNCVAGKEGQVFQKEHEMGRSSGYERDANLEGSFSERESANMNMNMRGRKHEKKISLTLHKLLSSLKMLERFIDTSNQDQLLGAFAALVEDVEQVTMEQCAVPQVDKCESRSQERGGTDRMFHNGKHSNKQQQQFQDCIHCWMESGDGACSKCSMPTCHSLGERIFTQITLFVDVHVWDSFQVPCSCVTSCTTHLLPSATATMSCPILSSSSSFSSFSSSSSSSSSPPPSSPSSEVLLAQSLPCVVAPMVQYSSPSFPSSLVTTGMMRVAKLVLVIGSKLYRRHEEGHSAAWKSPCNHGGNRGGCFTDQVSERLPFSADAGAALSHGNSHAGPTYMTDPPLRHSSDCISASYHGQCADNNKNGCPDAAKEASATDMVTGGISSSHFRLPQDKEHVLNEGNGLQNCVSEEGKVRQQKQGTAHFSEAKLHDKTGCTVSCAVLHQKTYSPTLSSPHLRLGAIHSACMLLCHLSKETANDLLFRGEGILATVMDTYARIEDEGIKGHLFEGVPGWAVPDERGKEVLTVLCALARVLRNVTTDIANQRVVGLMGGVIKLACSLHFFTTWASSIANHGKCTGNGGTQLVDSLSAKAVPESRLGSTSRSNEPPTGEEEVNLKKSNAAANPAVTSAPTMEDSAVNRDSLVGHLLLEITGTIRNLAVLGEHAVYFLDQRTIEALKAAMCAFPFNSALMLNITRVLSKLSLHGVVCSTLGKDKDLLSKLVHILNLHHCNPALILRAAFVFGNVTMASQVTRTIMGDVPKAIPTLTKILSFYFHAMGKGRGSPKSMVITKNVKQMDGNTEEQVMEEESGIGISSESAGESSKSNKLIQGSNQSRGHLCRSVKDGSTGSKVVHSRVQDNGTIADDHHCYIPLNNHSRLRAGPEGHGEEFQATQSECVEVLVKIIRAVANLAIDPRLGVLIGRDEQVADVLAGVLELFEFEEEEELVLNAAAAITNLSFYDGIDNQILKCHVSSATMPHQQCPATMIGSTLGMLGQLANESIAEYKQRFQTQLALIEAEEQRRVTAEAVRLQAEAAATAKKQRLQVEAEADTQARRKEAQDLLQRHESTSIEKLKFWHFEPSEEHDDATPEEQHKEFMAKLVTRLVYTCNHMQFELANLQRAVRNHKAQHEDAAQESERVDHVVAMLGDINTFAAPATISNQLDTMKTEVQQLHQLPNKDGNAVQHYKMPTFQIQKFDDYTHQDPIWLSHLATVDVADLKDKISWEELTRLWKKRFIVDDALTLAINRLFGMMQGNTSTRDWLTKWQKIAATPDLDLPFLHLRREFYNRSCAALSLALGDCEQYATFAEIIDKAREIIKTNRAAAHEKSAWQPTYVEKLLDAYGDVFEGPHGVVPDRPIRHEIVVEDGAIPPRGCIYRMSEEELSVLRAQLDDLLEKGWIRPSSSPYGAPVLFVRKKNKDLRLCIDYRKLNAQTIKNAGPLPCIDDLLERLGGAKFFSKLDLKLGYHQLEIRQEDRYKTAFKTRYGQFEWLVMPFGLTNAPATFQAAMTTEFRHMLDQFVLIYLDDILVYSRSLDEHVEHLRTVLERLRQAKYKANRDKCEFARQELEYLGHYVTPQGIRPLADKIEALHVWPEPTNTTDVRSFMGLAGYYQRFITAYSRIAAPITRLQSPKVSFVFDDDARRSFQALKTAMLMAPVLSIYGLTLPTRVTTDASSYGIGVVLEQHDGDD